MSLFSKGDIVISANGSITTVLDWNYSDSRFKDFLLINQYGELDMMGETCIKDSFSLANEEQQLKYLKIIHKHLIKNK